MAILFPNVFHMFGNTVYAYQYHDNMLHKRMITCLIIDLLYIIITEMNSVLRTIGLTTFMLAPILVGQLLSFIGYVWTGIFVAIWNVLSVIVEYTLLEIIYRLLH